MYGPDATAIAVKKENKKKYEKFLTGFVSSKIFKPC